MDYRPVGRATAASQRRDGGSRFKGPLSPGRDKWTDSRGHLRHFCIHTSFQMRVPRQAVTEAA